MNKLIKEWNLLDQIIYWISSYIHKLKDEILPEEPDVEDMIRVQTEHLERENALLKKLQFPRPLEREENRYCCPNCEIEIPEDFVEKYHIKFCPECGQRIFTTSRHNVVMSAEVSLK